MHRIDTITAEQDTFGPGKDGYTDGDPLNGIARTRTSADHLNAFQEEPCTVIEATGIVLDKADNGQLLQAVRRLFDAFAVANWSLVEGATAEYQNGIAYNGAGLWVMVGNGGTIRTSTDCLTWTTRTSGTTEHLNAVAYGASLWVAVGEAGKILTSTDGTTWVTRTSGTTEILYGIAHDGSGLWCAVGANATIRTSPTGTTWTSRTVTAGTSLYDVAHNGTGLWVAVGSGSGQAVVARSSDGASWTVATVSSSYFGSVAHGYGLWVAGQFGGEIYTSPDGVAWTLRGDMGFAVNSIAHGGAGVWVAVGNSLGIVVSYDGVNWTQRFCPGSGSLRAIANGGGLWCAIIGNSPTLFGVIRSLAVP